MQSPTEASTRGIRLAWLSCGRTGRALCILALLIVPFVGGSPALGAFPGANGLIAFKTDRDGNDEIYSMNPDGTNQIDLTNNPASDYTPNWSPDGSKIVFQSDRDGNYEIYTMNADGTNPIRLTNNPALDNAPVWSPDGRKIAFATDRDGNSEIYTMDADGTNQIDLTNDPAFDGDPNWSPDGQKIAFHRGPADDFDTDVFVMNTDGTFQTNLTNRVDVADQRANWSPDGSKIAFQSDRDGAGYEIYSMNADGTNPTRLTPNQPGFDPAWSPDGTRIVFLSVSAPSGNFDLYTMNAADGTSQTQLTNDSAFEQLPDWQPIISVNHPPDCSTVAASPNTLWPPRHNLRLITLSGATDPDGDTVTLTITDVTQDEPLNGLGDGDTSPDARAGSESNSVLLRAERSGRGDGRIYRVSFMGSDGEGGSCTGTVTVGVPKSMGPSSTLADSAPPSFNSLGP
jgi:TolB protein